MSQYLEVSSRIQSYLDGSMKSGGASCNTFIVEDNIPGIFEAATWAGQISQSQGAPTLILSKLRPAGAAISTGGTASGPCSFARLFDSIASVMLRPGKKNGVTVLFLDADHPDIDQWISYEFKRTLDRAYTGVLFRPGKKYSPELLEKIAAAYDEYRVGFLCKTTIQDGEELYPNVCAEIRQKHKGQCILGAMDLSRMVGLSTVEFIEEFKSAATKMMGYLEISRINAEENPHLYSYEDQVGLGFVGMANFLGLSGVTYQEAVEWMETELDGRSFSDMELSTTLMEWLIDRVAPEDKAGNFWVKFIGGVIAGSEAVSPRWVPIEGELGKSALDPHKVNRIWTSQPTAHTSLRLGRKVEQLSRKYLNRSTGEEREAILGYMVAQGMGVNISRLTDEQADQVVIGLALPTTIKVIGDAVAAELQPPYAVRLPGKQGSSVIDLSQLTGSTELIYDHRIQTRDEVPYEVYYRFCCLIQEVFDFTEKAHTLSHCVWAEKVDGGFVQRFLDGPLGSLYYRLESTPAQYLDKTETWDEDVDLTDLFAQVGDPEPTPVKGFCPIPRPGQNTCESCSM